MPQTPHVEKHLPFIRSFEPVYNCPEVPAYVRRSQNGGDAQNLAAYYEDKGIFSKDFRCEKYECCKKGACKELHSSPDEIEKAIRASHVCLCRSRIRTRNNFAKATIHISRSGKLKM